MRKIWKRITGYFFIILGIVGLFLPVLQGIFFIIIGLLLLAPESPVVQRMVNTLLEKYPDLAKKVRRQTKKNYK